MKRLKIKISGKVQGVFFRASTQAKAEELDIRGFTRNESDGSVYIEAEGEDKNLKEFVEWLREGPEYALVTGLELEEAEPRQYPTFEIRYE